MPKPAEATPQKSSRRDKAAAGWACDKPGTFQDLIAAEPCRPGKQHRLSWLNPAPLWASRNDRVARIIGDPVNRMRQEWLSRLPQGGGDLTVDVPAAPGGSISFLVMGDTGEGDASQFALVPALQSHADGTSFLFVCSDVIYPAGGIGDYLHNFFKPYRDYGGRIFAVPGNHDWYDNCTGFMYWFCGADSAPSPSGLLHKLLWRKPPSHDQESVDACRELRPKHAHHRQPGPYFAINAGPLKLVGIDTGIKGNLDEAQGRWLRRVSQGPEPKILLTGKPLYVDGERHRGDIDGGGTVDEIVRNRANNYIAAIGGDIHNYQRYPAKLEDGRTMLYLVSGGGGAFMHETHTLGNLDLRRAYLGLREKDFRCYPLRGDSLSRYSQLYAKTRIGCLAGASYIPPDQASALISEQTGIPVTRDEARDVTITDETRKTAKRLAALPKRGRGGLHIPFSEWLDSDAPPFFKHFLRIDADDESVRIRCFGVTGCGEEETDPTVEDDLRADLQDDGTWTWTLPAD